MLPGYPWLVELHQQSLLIKGVIVQLEITLEDAFKAVGPIDGVPDFSSAIGFPSSSSPAAVLTGSSHRPNNGEVEDIIAVGWKETKAE